VCYISPHQRDQCDKADLWLGAGTTEAAGTDTEPQLAGRMGVADDTPEPGWVMSERTP
jgi:hypothetical protein